MRAAALAHFFGRERRMNPVGDDVGTSRAAAVAEAIAAQRIGRVDANADNVTVLKAGGVERFERFSDDERRAIALGRRGREDVEPPWRNHRRAKGQVARIDQMDAQSWVPSEGG